MNAVIDVIVSAVFQIALFALIPFLVWLISLFVIITVQASLMAIFNEKLFGGSIWPSVLLHGLGNFCTTMLVAFTT